MPNELTDAQRAQARKLRKVFVIRALALIQSAKIQDDDASDLSFEIENAVIKWLNPQTVKDIALWKLPKAWPEWARRGFRETALSVLVERDAGSEYEDVEGYIDVIIMEDGIQQIFCEPRADQMDGHQVTKWIDEHFPEPATDEATPE